MIKWAAYDARVNGCGENVEIDERQALSNSYYLYD